jgi:hypothetical protein
MVAQSHEAASRHNELLRAAQEIADKNLEIQQLTHSYNAQKLRADRAELVNRQLESQIASPKREAITVYTKMKLDTDRVKHDAALAKLFSDGWSVVCDGTVLVADPVERYTTLSRVKPIEPATDQPPMTVTVGNPVGAAATPPVQTHIYPGDPATFPPAHPFIGGLWNALYAMDRFAELVQHWPKLAEYAPRVHAILAAAGCDMADVKIMKSFRLGHRADEWTIKVNFPNSKQIAPGTRTALAAAGVRELVARDGREFIFDLPAAWVGETPRKTITASSMTIMTEGNAPGVEADVPSPAADVDPQDVRRAQLHDIAQDAYNDAMARNPLPPYRKFPFTSPSSV